MTKRCESQAESLILQKESEMINPEVASRRDALKTGAAAVAAVVATAVIPAAKAEAAQSGPRWAMVVDLRKCTGCRACTIACKAEYGVSLGRFNTVVKNVEFNTFPDTEKHFLPRLCNNCAGGEGKDVPPCVEKCPQAKAGKRMKLGKERYRTGATYKRPDGMVLNDMSLCIGCYKCIDACPYGVRSIDPFVKLTLPNREKDLGIGKCTFCAHRVDQGIMPACVNTCEGRSRNFGDLNDPDSMVAKYDKEFNLTGNKAKTTLLPAEKTDPHVFYVDSDNILARYTLNKENKQQEFIGTFE
jgi:tetrathionate reductase subunit B